MESWFLPQMPADGGSAPVVHVLAAWKHWIFYDFDDAHAQLPVSHG